MSYTTANTTNITRQEIYDTGLMESFKDKLFDMGMMWKDYTSVFPDGDRFNIDQIGDVTIQDYQENTDIDFTAIDFSRLELRVTEYKQSGFYQTDKAKQDSWKLESMAYSSNIRQSMEAYAKDFETSMYAVSNQQTIGDPNNIAGYPHRVAMAAGWTAQNFFDQMADAKLALDKVNAPEVRIMVVDATVENVLNKAVGLVSEFNPSHRGIVETGFAKSHRFIRSVHGIDLFVSNLLPRITGETVDGALVSAGIANLIMVVDNEDVAPFMGVVRQSPESEFERNKTKKRDEWSSTTRYGLGLRRPESLITIITQNP